MAGLRSTYLIHGDDHGKVAERRTNLIALAGRLGATLELLDGDLSTPDSAYASLAAMTLGNDLRVIVVDEVQRWKDADCQAHLAPALAQMPPDTTIAFFAREEPSKTGKGGGKLAPPSLVAAVQKAGGSISNDALPVEKDLTGWVAREARAAGLTLDREAAELIAARVGRRPSRLARSIEVLLLASGPDASLVAEDVAPFVGDDAELVAWPLVDALVAGDRPSALRLLLELGSRGESLVRLLAMCDRRARELRDISIRLSSGESPKAIEPSVKGPPFARSRRVAEAKRADPAWLDALVLGLARVERDTRGGTAGDPAVTVVRELFAPAATMAR